MANSVDFENLSASVNGTAALPEDASSSPAQLMAQAQAEPVPVDAGSGQPVTPVQPTAAAPATPAEFEADASNVVHLPANISIDNIKVDGDDLVLEQADGSLIVIKDAAANVPTFLIGDVEVPRVALIAALEAGGVDVAFGPDGSMSAGQGSTASSGGNFEAPVGGIGNGFDLSLLLPPTALRFPQYDVRELTPGRNADPRFGDFSIQLSEEGLPGGNADTSGNPFDSTNKPIHKGTFGATDGNGDKLTYSLGLPTTPDLTSGGKPIIWHLDGPNLLVGKAGDVVVIRFEITNPKTGEYEVEISGPVDHPHKGAEDVLGIDVPVTVKDPFGASATANVTLEIEDDSPEISTLGDGASVTVDETLLGTSVTTDFASSFKSSYGGDGAGSIVYALSVAAGETGLVDTATGQAVVLSMDGGTVVGKTAGGLLVFTLSVDSEGKVTLDQSRAIKHADPNNHDDSKSLADDLIKLTATITDKDGDSKSATLNIGANLVFKDDGPSLKDGDASAAVDEDDIRTLWSQGTSPDGDTEFLTGAAKATGSLAAIVNFGADGAAAGGGFGFTATAETDMQALGLQSKGAPLSYVVVGNALIAYVDNGNGHYNPLQDRPVFSMTVNPNSGDFTFRLFDQLDHVKPAAGADENTQLATTKGPLDAIDFGSVIKATDGDGDFIVLKGKVDITVTDDIPQVYLKATTNASVIHDETAGLQQGSQGDDTDSAAVKQQFSALGGTAIGYAHQNNVFTYGTEFLKQGADEPIKMSVALAIAGDNGTDSLLKTTAGLEISLYLKDGLIIGRVDNADGSPNPNGQIAFAVAIDQNGGISVAQYLALQHPKPGDGSNNTHDEPVNLGNLVKVVLTATDNDGDTIEKSINIGTKIVFEDDGPSLKDGDASAAVDEDDIRTLWSQGTSPDGDTEFLTGAAKATGSLAAIVNFGADGAAAGGGFGFTATAETDMQALGLQSKGAPLSYVVVGNALIAYVDNGNGHYNPLQDRPVFSMTVNPNSGDFTFRLFDQLDHVKPAAGADENTQLATTKGPLDAIDFGSVIKATDGDGDFIVLKGKVDITVTDDIPQVYLKATTNASVIHDETAGLQQGSQGDDTDSAAVKQQFSALGGTAIGYAHQNNVFTYGTEFLKQGADEPIKMSVALAIAGDNGTDSLLKTTAGLEISLYLKDGLIIGRVDNADGSPNPNGQIAFAVAIDQNGGISVAQYLALQHPKPGDGSNNTHDEPVNLGNLVKVVLTATDNDGDTIEKSINIGTKIVFEDDGPVVLTSTSAARDWTLDEDILVDGAPHVDGNDARDDQFNAPNPHFQDTNDYAGNAINGKPLGIGWGADGAGKVAFVMAGSVPNLTINGSMTAGQLSSGGVPLHYVISQVGDGEVLTAYKGVGGEKVFTLSLDPDAGATGSFSFQLFEELDHLSGNGQGALSITFPFIATDGDGDSVRSEVVIRVTDDVPYAPDAPQNLIANGDFTNLTGAQSESWGTLASGASGWTLGSGGGDPVAGHNQFELTNPNYLGMFTPGGFKMLDMAASPGNIAISQTVAGAAAGQIYAISFFAGAPFPGTAMLEVMWGGEVIGTINPGNQMTSYSFLVKGDAGNGDKTLTLREVGTGNEPLESPNATEGYHGTYVANVQMLPVNAFVDEDNLPKGLNDQQVGDVEPAGVSASGSLGIFWGSDNADKDDAGGVQDGASATDDTGDNTALTGRALYFTSASVTATGTAGTNGTVLTSQGQTVSFQLVENGTKLVGYVDNGDGKFGAGDRLVFDVKLSDDGAGSFKFTLHDQLDHAPNANENDITLKFDYTARDFDGDTDTGSFIVGVDDDMPVVNVGAGTSDPAGSLALQLDETVQPDGPRDNNHDRYNGAEGESAPSTGNNGGDDDVAPSPQNYNQVPVIKTNPDASEAIGSRTTTGGAIGNLFTGWQTPAFGADGPGANGGVAQALSFVLGGGAGGVVATNLSATQTGAPELSNQDAAALKISLHQVSDTVLEGRTAGGFVAFRITLNNAGDPEAATITVDQFMAIAHGNTALYDENLALQLASGGSLGIKLDVTVTDADGDKASDSATVKIGDSDGSFISFDDDGPKVISVVPTVPQLGPDLIVNGSFEIGHENVLGGQDWEIFHSLPGWTSDGNVPFEVQTGGAGGMAPQSGNALVELDSDTVGNPANGNVGDINATNSTNATIQQTIAGTEAGQTYQLSFAYSPRGGEGAGSSGMQVWFDGKLVYEIPANNGYAAGSWHQITINVTASGPNAVLAFKGTGSENQFGALLDDVSLRAVYNATLDDEDVPNGAAGIQGGPGDDGAGNVATGKILFDAGTDGLKSIEATGIDGLKAIHVDGNGIGTQYDVAQAWLANGAGGTLTGTIDVNGTSVTVYTLTVDATGNYTFTLLQPLVHPLQNDPATDEAETEYEDNLLLDFGFTITDGDGDRATGVIRINVDDDTPDAKTSLPTPTEMDEPGSPESTTVNQTYEFGGANGSTPDLGSVSVNAGTVVANVGAGATLQGPPTAMGALPIVFTADPGTTFKINGAAIGVFGPTAGTVTLIGYDANGNVVATHNLQAALVGAVTITPSTVFSAIGTAFANLELSKLELVPPSGYAGRIIVDNLALGHVTVTPSVTEKAEIDLMPLVNFGEDGAHANGAFQLNTVAAQDFGSINSGGQEVQIVSSGGKLLGFTAGNAKVFEVEIVNGKAVLTLFAPLDHNGQSHLQLDFSKFITARDGDGDGIGLGDGSVVFSVKEGNLKPTAVAASAAVDDDGLPNSNSASAEDDINANIGETPTVNPSEAIFNGKLEGSGGNGALVYSFAGMHGQQGTIGQDNVEYSWDGTASTLTATIDGSSRNGQTLFEIKLNPATGEYQLTLLKPVMHTAGDNSEASVSSTISFTVGDSDADTSVADTGTGSLTITFNDDVPTATPVVHAQVLDDEGQPGGITASGAAGDVAGNVKTASGMLGIVPGADGLQKIEVSLGSVAGEGGALAGLQAIYVDPLTKIATVGDVTTAWTQDDVGGVLIGKMTIPGVGQFDVFKLTVDNAGNYTLEMLRPLAHPLTDNPATDGVTEQEYEDDLSLVFNYTVTDGDGDTDSSTLTVKVDDDTLDLGTPQSINVGNGVSTTIGSFVINPGADGIKEIDFTSRPAGLKSGGVEIQYAEIGNKLVAHTGDVTKPVFTLTVNATGGYTYQSFKPLDGTTSSVLVGSSSAYGSGPGTAYILESASGKDLAIVSGWSAGGALAGVKGAATGWGPGNDGNLNTGEMLRFDFQDADNFGVPGFTPPPFNGPAVSEATFSFKNLGGDTVTYVVHYTDNSPSQTGTVSVNPQTFTAPPGKFIDYIEIIGTSVSGGGGKVSLESVSQVETNVDLKLQFGVKIVDGDGDAESATIHVGVKDTTPVITDLKAAADGGDVRVDEDDLANGSDTDKESLTQTGAFKIQAGDGIDDLTVGGHSVFVNGVFQANTSFVTPMGSTLKFTSYDSSTGEVKYEYTLATKQQHADASGENELSESFAVVLTDTDGDAETASLEVVIVDDIAVARSDADSVAEATGSTRTGNVVTGAGAVGSALVADTIGADGPAAPVTGFWKGEDQSGAAGTVGGAALQGAFGTLQLNANGSYTYTVTATGGVPAGSKDTFTYAITDGDGDVSYAQLVIDIAQDANKPVITGDTGLVYEDGLADGLQYGADSETTEGTFKVTANGEAFTLTVGGATGTTVTSAQLEDAAADGDFSDIAAVNTGKGLLTITGYDATTGVVSYSYTLTSAQTHTGQGEGTPISDTITISVTDATGDTAPGSIKIDIVDDIAVARSDADSVAEATGSTTTGNVVTGAGAVGSALVADTIGADGPAAPVTGFWKGEDQSGAAGTVGGAALQGAFGTLQLNANGSYTYTVTATGGVPAGSKDTFTYAITDGDGDVSYAQLVIDIAQDANKPVITGDTGLVYEDGLADGLQYGADSETTEGTFKVTANGEAFTLTVGGATGTTVTSAQLEDAAADGDFSDIAAVNTGKGLLTITGYDATTGVVSYSYTLTSAQTHTGQGEGTPISDTITISVTDATGDTAPGSIKIDIVDDIAVARSDADSVAEATGSTRTGNVVTGAGAVGSALVADTIGADGPAAPVTGFWKGEDQSGAAGTVGGAALQGAFGTLQLNANGSYTYTVTATGGVPAGSKDTFTYAITDGDGDVSYAQLVIDIAQDANKPVITGDTGLVYEDGLADGLQYGADSETTEGTFKVTANGEAFTLTVGGATGTTVTSAQLEDAAADGDFSDIAAVNTGKGLLTITGYDATTGVVSYSYTLTSAQTHTGQGEGTPISDTIAISVTDATGDTGTGEIKIDIVDDIAVARSDADSVAEATGSTTTGNVVTGAGAVGSALVADTIGADGPAAPVTGFWKGEDQSGAAGTVGGAALQGVFGTLQLNANGSYTYKVTATGGVPAGSKDTFTYAITDGDGDVSYAQLVIDIAQDANKPVITGDTGTVYEDGLAGGSQASTERETDATGSFKVTANGEAFTLTVGGAGGTAVTSAVLEAAAAASDFTGIAAINTGEGVLTITGYNAATGVVSYSYTLSSAQTHTGQGAGDPVVDTIAISVTDATGDTGTGEIKIDIVDDVPTVNIVNPSSATVNESSTLNGTWTLVAGADGVTSVEVTVGSVTKVLSLASNGNTVVFGPADGLPHGTLTVDADLQWHFTANAVAADQSVTFSIKAKDGDNDTSSDTQTLTIKNVSGPLTIQGAVTGTVEEEHGLAGGIEDVNSAGGQDLDVAGQLDNTTNVETGSFADELTFSGVEGTLSFAFAPLSGNPPVLTLADGPLTSGGKPVLFAMEGSNLVGYVDKGGGAGYHSSTDTKVFTVTLGSGGAYTFTLNAPVDHPIGGGENTLAINLNGRVTATDSGGPGTDSALIDASITVIDDAPLAKNDIASVMEGSKPTMNAILVIDLSLSMGSTNPNPAPGYATRLALMQAAVQNLLSSSDVTFKEIVVYTFADGAYFEGRFTMNPAGAIAEVNSYSQSSLIAATQYDTTAAQVASHFNANIKPTFATADQTNLYFLTDGDPQGGSALDTTTEQANWLNFINGNNIDHVYAIGFGGITNTNFLDPMAPRPGDEAIAVTNPADLAATLEGTLPGQVSGNVLYGNDNLPTGTDNDSFGADGGRILSIKVGSVTYTYDPSGNDITASSGANPTQNTAVLQVTTSIGGTLTFNFSTGAWDYKAPAAGVNSDTDEVFQYVLIDNDGDKANASLTITVLNQPNVVPVLALDAGLSGNYRDEFGSNSYSNTNGTKTWTTSWTEADDNGNVSNGDIRVTGGRLRFGDGTDTDNGGASLTRVADLTGAATATLSFTVEQAGADNGEDLIVQAWNGTSWQTIGTFLGSDADGTTNFSVNLTPAQIGAHTQIRFVMQNSLEQNEFYYVDNVNIAYSAPQATNFATTYTENGVPVSIAAAGPSITDTDDTQMASATIVLTNAKPGDVLVVGTLPAGITSSLDYSGGQIKVTLTGAATKAAYQTAIKAVAYANTSENPDPSPRTIQVKVNDGEADSNLATTTIQVNAVNDAPIILAPNNLQYDPAGSDDTTAFNRIRFADADTTGNVTVTISRTAGDGTFTLTGAPVGGTAALSSSNSVATLTGTIAAINAWIAANNLTMDSQGNDDDTFSISINDGTTTTTKTGFLVSDVSFTSSTGTDINNYAGVNVYETTLGSGAGNDTTYTSWSHLGGVVTYDGGANSGGSDTIHAIMTASQLQDVLSTTNSRDALQAFLNTPSAGLDLSGTTWGGKATNFENANIQLAKEFSTRDTATPGNNFHDISTTWKSVIAGTEIVGMSGTSGNNFVVANGGGTVEGLGGNDVLVATDQGNTLLGGLGSDLLLGGDGDDILDGGAGLDYLAGGKGADTFKITSADANDLIADYDFMQGDKIDISALLDTAFGPGDHSNLVQSGAVSLTASGNDVILSVDINGSASGGMTAVATLVGYNTDGADAVKILFDSHTEVTVTI